MREGYFLRDSVYYFNEWSVMKNRYFLSKNVAGEVEVETLQVTTLKVYAIRQADSILYPHSRASPVDRFTADKR